MNKMKIIIDCGCYELSNMGDAAMLQVAVSRLRKLWPEASIEILTSDPDYLRLLCPGAIALCSDGRSNWFNNHNILGRLHKLFPKNIESNITNLGRWSRNNYPFLYTKLVNLKTKIRGKSISKMDNFVQSFFNSDMFVISGGGTLNDHFKSVAMTMLDTLDIASKLGIVTALFSQGIGPIISPDLYKRAKEVLPKVDFITVRANLASTAILKSIGVEQKKIIITGDDAIELAYQYRSEKQGRFIGANVRVASYSQVDEEHKSQVARELYTSAKKYQTSILPIPVSFYSNEADMSIINQIVPSDYLAGEYISESDFSPQKIIEKVSLCRVVITGSYHSAVFALSQGIPVIGLAQSQYYKNKFLGLANQFGYGCEVIFYDDKDFSSKISYWLDYFWNSADKLRPLLIDAAQKQIHSAQKAYHDFYDSVEIKTGKISYRNKNKEKLYYVLEK